MQNRAEAILNAINGDVSRANILTAPTHESYQSNLKVLPQTFWMMQRAGVIKPWNEWSRPVPENHVLLPENQNPFPSHISFDIVLSQNKFGQFQTLKPFADAWSAPLISLEHTWPHPSWPKKHLNDLKALRGDFNVFISEQSCEAWGWSLDDPSVYILRHGIDTRTFSPHSNIKREKYILTVANDYINRDWCLGYGIYQRVTSGLQVRPVGATPGLSEKTNCTEDLVREYRKAGVFLNTSTYSPIPMSLLEAAACGCPIVTNDTCACGDLIEDGVNGFITSDEKTMKDRLQWMLDHPVEAQEMGNKARQTVEEKFSLDAHIKSWTNLISKAYGSLHNQW